MEQVDIEQILLDGLVSNTKVVSKAKNATYTLIQERNASGSPSLEKTIEEVSNILSVALSRSEKLLQILKEVKEKQSLDNIPIAEISKERFNYLYSSLLSIKGNNQLLYQIDTLLQSTIQKSN